MNIIKTVLYALLICFLSAQALQAQNLPEIAPISHKKHFAFQGKNLPQTILPAKDFQALANQDFNGLNPLISVANSVDISPSSQGEWSLIDGHAVWRMEIYSQGAPGLAVFFDQINLPAGAQLFVYDQHVVSRIQDDKKEQFLGPFVSDRIVVEYNCKAEDHKFIAFHINRIDQVFDVDQVAQVIGFGDALPCQININCPEGDDYQDFKRGASRILMVFQQGMGWCSGSLINNTRNDGTPYYLTAFHCQHGYTPYYHLWRFDFNYEAVGCDNPPSIPSFQPMIGAEFRAMRAESDFLLLELQDSVPKSYNAFFNGWSRKDEVPEYSGLVHHAAGDIKKISLDEDPGRIKESIINWNNGITTPPRHHLEIHFDHGTIEPGSSGAPLFNHKGLIVGQLHGGNADCENFRTFHGRFQKSWQGSQVKEEQLRAWLDPIRLGVTEWPGIDNPVQGEDVEVVGKITDLKGQPLPFVPVLMTGDVHKQVLTNEEGEFRFQSVREGSQIEIRAYKDINPRNGVSARDLFIIQKHLLGIELLTTEILYAADVTGDGKASAKDLVSIQKLLLGKEEDFPNDVPSWKFIPSRFNFVVNPAGHVMVDFRAVKTGDVNLSADPTQ